MKLFEKINIVSIVSRHIETLKNNNTNKLGFDDFITFILLPIMGVGILLYFDVPLKGKAINIIITTLSILVGLLFNVIVIIFDIIKRDNSQKIKNIVLEEILKNISFSILLSIFIITATLLTFIDISWFNIIVTAIVYFLLFNYLFTVLMILKRMNKLFLNEIYEINKEND